MPEAKQADRFISFEGIDGAGKSTHIRWFADALGVRVGRDRVVLTREPGGTELGERLRDLLLAQAMHADTEALLMFAARAEHLAQVISPALAAGHWVLSDRFTDASYAYQGGGRGIASARLQHLEQFTHAELQPTLTVLFDIDPLLAARRRHGARDADKFEAEALDFHRRTRHAYLARVAENPRRFAVVDAAGTPDQVQNELKVILKNINLSH